MAKASRTKTTNKAVAVAPQTQQQKMAAFYAGRLLGIENKINLVSNSIVEPDRVSSGVLLIDWIFGGGFVPGMSSIAGEEQSSKTTILYHTLAQAKARLHLPYNCLYDAEGSVSPKYTGKIWEPFGLDVKHLLSKAGRDEGFYYFRNQVIEQMFDYLKQALKLMPDKNWNSEAKTWCYYFPKRDEYFSKLLQALDMKPDRNLSAGGGYYVVPTDYAGPEGFFGADSFAALVTREEEDKDETGSTRSALEAAEFSKQLKRVKVDLADKKVSMLGTNQLRSHVRAQYGSPDDQQYEPGGNALKFYSEARARTYSRAGSASKKFGPWFEADKDNSKFGIENSVEFAGGKDRYAYKEIKNTKNKFGKPGLKGFIRVWVSDAQGNPRGIDPVFDVYMYLRNTQQIRYQESKKAGGKGLVFNLKPSVGAKRAGVLNDLAPFTYLDFKAFIIAEYTADEALFRQAAAKLGLRQRVNLRETLLQQVRKDDSVYANIAASAKTEDDEMEETEDYEAEEL